MNDVAVKVITRSTLVSKKMDETEVYKEICIMASLQDHPNIVSIQDFFEDAKAFYIVMDLMEGGDLFKRLKRLKSYSEKDARDLCSSARSNIWCGLSVWNNRLAWHALKNIIDKKLIIT